MLSLENSAKQFAKHLLTVYPKREIREIVKKTSGNPTGYAQYQADPVAFGEQVLGESYTDDVRRMMESVRDHVITIAKSGNAVGKTHAAARVAVWWYKAFPDSQIYTAAAPPESNLRKLLWGEIGSITTKHPELFSGDALKILHIERSPQSFLAGVTIPLSGTAQQREAKFSGKHAPNLLFILDEGDAIPPEVYQGIESCMSGGHARLLIMFNPRAEMGPVNQMERSGTANVVSLSAFHHPNVLSGEDKIPGAVSRETTVRRINQWCRPLVEGESTAETFELPHFLVGTIAMDPRKQAYQPLKAGLYKIINSAFSYMVLGQYPAQAENQLISREWIYAARARWDAYVAQNGQKAPIGSKAIVGLDVAEFGQDLNSICFRYGGYVEPLMFWTGLDPIQTGERASNEYLARPCIQINVDSTGVGAGTPYQLAQRKCNAVSVKVAEKPTIRTEQGEFKILRDQLWWSCREWLRTDPGAMLPPDEVLIEELQTPTYQIQGGKIRVMDGDTMREMLKRSPDRATSLVLTFADGKPGVMDWLEQAGRL